MNFAANAAAKHGARHAAKVAADAAGRFRDIPVANGADAVRSLVNVADLLNEGAQTSVVVRKAVVAGASQAVTR